MHTLNINERSGVNILGFNSPEWVISYMGGLFYNSVCTGVYLTNNADACFYQADHSDAELIVCDSIE